MAEGGYNVSVTTQSSGRKGSETPDVKKKKKNPVHGVQKRLKRINYARFIADITSGGNDQTASTGGNSDNEDEQQEISQTSVDLVPIENAPPSPSPPHSQLNPPVYDHKDSTQQRTQLSQPLHVQSQLNPLAETEDYNHLDVIHNQQQETDAASELQKMEGLLNTKEKAELNKFCKDLETKQRELARKNEEIDLLSEQNKELKERLLRIEIDRQCGIVVKSDPPKHHSLPDQSNELRQLEERCRHLQTHNGKLTVQFQQQQQQQQRQQQQYEEQSKQQKELITELVQKIEELSDENKKLQTKLSQLQRKVKTSSKFDVEQCNVEKVKQELTDAASELQKMEELLNTKEKELQLLREDNERKANVVDLHLIVLKQKEEEIEKLKITIAVLEAAKGEQLGTLTDEITQKEAKIIKQHVCLEDMREEMSEVIQTKDQELYDLNQQLEETKTELAAKNQEIADLEQQLRKTIIQLHDDNAAVNAKQLKIVELTEQLDLAKAEAVGFKEDFEQERSDREKIHYDLTTQVTKSQTIAKDLRTMLAKSEEVVHNLQTQMITSQNVAKELQQKLNQAVHNKQHEFKALQQQQLEDIEALQKQIATLQEQKSTLEELTHTLTDEEDRMKNLEEEKLVLTQQVKAYSRQCEELKKTMAQLQEKSMTLEEQVYYKERIATEIDELKAQLQDAEAKAQSALDSRGHILSVFQTEQKKVAELEWKLSSQMKTMDIENSKLRNANKDLQLLNEENKKKFDYFRNVLKERAEEIKNVKATEFQLQTELKEAKSSRDQCQQSNIHLFQQLQESQHQLEESLRTVRIQHQHLEELCSQQEQPQWVVDREEVTMIEEVLGGGSYGKVEVAIFRGLRVAVKSLHGLIMSDYTRELFFREMDIASKVRHPNLVQFIGATTVGTPIILTEIMATSLYKELQKNAALRRSQILSISKDVASALNYLHLMKPHPIIHRDISSPNVLLEPSVGDSYKAKVADYGAANLQPRSRTHMPGNSAYASPECYLPYNHTPAIDVYSYSVLLLEMTLHCPPAMSVEEREQQSRRVSWPSMASLIKRCLNRDHSLRPTMRQILDDLTVLKV